MANGQYEKLIAHYDIQRGISDPASGLGSGGKAHRLAADLVRKHQLCGGAGSGHR